MRPTLPAYRQKSVNGRTYGVVTLADATTGKRRDYLLGDYDAPQSRQKYARLITEWEAAGRRLPMEPGSDTTIVELVVAHARWAESCYAPQEVAVIKSACKVLCALYGDMPAESFRPMAMRLVREEMIKKGWCRTHINKQVQRLCAVFRWGTANDYAPVTVYQALKTLEPLKRGRSQARESVPVKPVDDRLVDAIEPFVSRQVWAMVQLQRRTGARPGELVNLRKGDIEREEGALVWKAHLREHKNAHRGHSRMIPFGPESQRILAPFMNRADDVYLFSPAEAERERRQPPHAEHSTPLDEGDKPGDNCVGRASRGAGDHYTTYSYRRAIARGCDAAFPPPPELARQRVPAHGRKKKATRWETGAEWRERLGPEKWKELCVWIESHRWHPHQLRHAAATAIRKQFGLEAAQLVLGHSSALVTEAVYAERDEKKITDVMARIG